MPDPKPQPENETRLRFLTLEGFSALATRPLYSQEVPTLYWRQIIVSGPGKMERTFTYSKALLGFIAFLSVVLVTLLSQDGALDRSLRVAVIAISLALPAFITTVGIWEEIDPSVPRDTRGGLFYVLGLSNAIGYIASFVALVSIFWHFSGLAAFLFGLGSLMWLFLTLKYFRDFHRSPNRN